MTFAIRYTTEALEDFERLYDYLVVFDISLADRAYNAIEQAIKLLEILPFSCRQAISANDPLLRELVVPFGSSGYVVLFRIDGNEAVTIAAVRHQREDDYH